MEKLEGNGENCCEVEPSISQLPHTVIIDCSAFAFIDLAGAKTLKAVSFYVFPLENNRNRKLRQTIACQFKMHSDYCSCEADDAFQLWSTQLSFL